MYNQDTLKKIVEKAISSLSYDTGSELLTDPVKYVLSMGGKRLRPVLALMTCNIFSDKIDDAVIPAAGLEVFHNFTLVHDDIMDKADIRRNLPTVQSKWNVNQAILSGDVMAFIAIDCFLQSPPEILHKVLRIFNKTAIDVCTGQQLDMDFEKSHVVSLDEYIIMIGLKTAALTAASARIGACFGGANDKNCSLAEEFGKNLGIAFQIQDDLLDLYGETHVFGKALGGDIIANKKTFLFVKAMELAGNAQKKKLLELYTAGETDTSLKIKAVKSIYDELGIKTITENTAGEYVRSALGFLDLIEVARERKAGMMEMVNSLLGRDY